MVVPVNPVGFFRAAVKPPGIDGKGQVWWQDLSWGRRADDSCEHGDTARSRNYDRHRQKICGMIAFTETHWTARKVCTMR